MQGCVDSRAYLSAKGVQHIVSSILKEVDTVAWSYHERFMLDEEDNRLHDLLLADYASKLADLVANAKEWAVICMTMTIIGTRIMRERLQTYLAWA